MHQQLDIKLSYKVFFETDIFSLPQKDFWKAILPENLRTNTVVFIDSGVTDAFPFIAEKIHKWSAENLNSLSFPYILKGGEEVKNDFKIIETIGKIAIENSICRHSYFIIIGGGAFLDAVCFAASIIHRGIRQIRIPTTVLAQNDSGLGVKNAINYFDIKNFFGTFYPPYAVVNDKSFLTGLQMRDWISGIAEAFKVAIIKDKTFLYFLVKSGDAILKRDLNVMEKIVRRCAELHLNHIASAGDPFETGSSRPLDFGHWVAHKLETMSNGQLRHGEAVAIGMTIDLFSAHKMGLISSEELHLVLNAMQSNGLKLWSDLLLKKDNNGNYIFIEGLAEFREHIGGELTLIMPNGLGKMKNIHKMPKKLIEESIQQMQQL